MARRFDRLSFQDAEILGLESAVIAGHTCKVAVVEPPQRGEPLELEELRRHVEARLDRVPRCRQRVAYTPLRLAGPAWVDDPAFDIREHVRPVETSGPVNREELRRIAAELMAGRLDHRRPLWRIDLVGPLADGGSAIVWRVHHCMADGVAALRLGSLILWDEEPSPEPPEPAGWRPEPEPASVELVYSALAERLADARRSAAGAGQAALSPRRWADGARALARLPKALIRELTPLGSDSPLDRRIGRRREVAMVRRPLDELKRIEHALGDSLGAKLTINDLLLAAVAGALREWLREDGSRPRALRVQVPVSMHQRTEHPDELGNRDSFLFVDLPLGEADPVRRLELINAETRERKERHDAEALYSFFHALSRLGPGGRRAEKLLSGPREFSLSVSNVPGPREPVYVMGGRVAELYSVAEPADRHALRVSAVSAAGTMFFGLCTDPEALGGLHRLAVSLDHSLNELSALC